MAIISSSEFRLKVLTLKHHARQKVFELLESPNAPIYVKVIGLVAAILLLTTILKILSWLMMLVFFQSDSISYLQEYYDPKTPRFLDTSDFRSSDDNIFDLEAYKEELFHLNEYNTYLSDRLPINRVHKDPRSEKCRNKAKKLPPDSELPLTSIVIVMFNEELSVILRTIVSILLNSPMEAIKEVIIIDDKSNKDELGDRLDQELSAFAFVKLIRNSKREGLIRSRIIGSKAAEGSILIFLDSHVEMGQGWFQPLVARVMEDPKTVVCPTIAAIDHTSLDLIADKYSNIWGVWDWDMSFRWAQIPQREAQRRDFDESNPIRTPAMAGGLYAMQKEFFFDLGAYDPGMKIWGAENLEMSFRTWMCGGAIEINTCSIVGHIFRKAGVIAKSVAGELAMKQNVKRAVEVWMDDYKETHYHAVPASKKVDEGDIVSRVLLRQRLKCRTFEWYLKQVYPELHRPDRDFVGYGQLKGPSDVCMDSMGQNTGQQVGVYRCHGEGSAQFWKLLLTGELMNRGYCLDGDDNNPRNIVMYECHGLKGNQQWFITEDGIIHHGGSGKCLSHDGTYLLLLRCDSTDPRFKWEFGAENVDLRSRFYEIHAKQFQYKTKDEVKMIKLEKEARKAAAQRERDEISKQREELRKRESKKNSPDGSYLKDSEVAQQKPKSDMLSEDEKEFRLWKAEKKKREEAEKKEKEDEELRKQKEAEELREQEEAEALKKEEAKTLKKQEEIQKQKEDELQRLQDEEDRKKFEFDKAHAEKEVKQLVDSQTEVIDNDSQNSANSSNERIDSINDLSSIEQEKINNLRKQAAELEQQNLNENKSIDTVEEPKNENERSDLSLNDADDNILDKPKNSDKLQSNKDIDDEQLKEFLAWKAAKGSA